MKSDHAQKILPFVILLLFLCSIALNASPVSSERSGPITPPNAIYEKMLKHLVRSDTCQFSDSNIDHPAVDAKSYDPHSQLIFQSELEAGRIVLYLDAYYGQSLKMEIQDYSGKVVADLSRAKVIQNYIHVDLAAWECGTYYILLMNHYGEVQHYQFVID